MSQSTAEFLVRLRQYIQDEASAQYKALEHQWAFPLNERVAKGWAIEEVKIEDFQKGIIRLSCQTNDSRFREGDLVVLHRGNPRDENALHCDLQYDGETALEISLKEGNEYLLSLYPEGLQAKVNALRQLQSVSGEELSALMLSVLDRALKAEL